MAFKINGFFFKQWSATSSWLIGLIWWNETLSQTQCHHSVDNIHLLMWLPQHWVWEICSAGWARTMSANGRNRNFGAIWCDDMNPSTRSRIIQQPATSIRWRVDTWVINEQSLCKTWHGWWEGSLWRGIAVETLQKTGPSCHAFTRFMHPTPFQFPQSIFFK